MQEFLTLTAWIASIAAFLTTIGLLSSKEEPNIISTIILLVGAPGTIWGTVVVGFIIMLRFAVRVALRK